MRGFFKFSSEKSKSKTKRNLTIDFSKKDFLLVLIFPSLAYLLTNDTFLGFVVTIVKLIMNGSFYYFCNNRIFVFNEVKYGS